MKNVFIYCVILMLLLGFTGCKQGGGFLEPFVGIWINPAYNGMAGNPPGKMIFEDDNETLQTFNNVSDTTPLETGSISIEEKDYNNPESFFYKMIYTGPSGKSYLTGRVSADRNTLEWVYGLTAFPAEIDPSDPNYSTFSRQ